MQSRRTAGILLHPTSLPGRHGIGDLGEEAHNFVRWLASARQGLWQVLPLGQTGFGDSPYQCFSAFAGNPLLVSPERLVNDGWLDAADIASPPAFPARAVDFEAAKRYRLPLLQRAYERFEARAGKPERERFLGFCAEHAAWLDDYALFTALKNANGRRSWTEWPRGLALRDPAALDKARRDLAPAVRARQFFQYQFFRQWEALRLHCHEKGIRIMGDVPIFVAHDSADVWAHPELFRLEPDGRPSCVAGVPPDYFSATGQLWGNPLYRWRELRSTGYAWWIERIRATLRVVDVVRLDHFRGFEAYWEVPAGEATAVNGRWVKGPGAAFFRALEEALGELPIVAENLGVITPAVEAIRERFSFPGMAILQFAFGADAQGPGFRPHNYSRNLVVYTGTHDNDTTVGWWTSSGAADSTRSRQDVEREHDHCRRYLGMSGDREVHWAFIRAALASVADTAIVPMQDVLGLGSEARMNLPGRAAGNWRWRYEWSQVSDAIRDRLADLTVLFGRV
jgi:4-alpha-glucanotransferase